LAASLSSKLNVSRIGYASLLLKAYLLKILHHLTPSNFAVRVKAKIRGAAETRYAGQIPGPAKIGGATGHRNNRRAG